MVATSLAISSKVLESFDLLKTEEDTLLINAIMIDDVLGVAVLTIITAVVVHGSIGFYEVAKIMAAFFAIGSQWWGSAHTSRPGLGRELCHWGLKGHFSR